MLNILSLLFMLSFLAEVSSVEYVVYPSTPDDIRICNRASETLSNMGLARVKRYNSIVLPVTYFWLIEANEAQADRIKRTVAGIVGAGDVLPNHPTLTDNCGSLFRSDQVQEDDMRLPNTSFSATNFSNPSTRLVSATQATSLTAKNPVKIPRPKQILMQRDARQDLDLVSWPPGRKLPWRGMEGYVYNVTEGSDTYIYVIGNGINAYHREFVQSGGENWFFGPNVDPNSHFRDESSPPGYTSCAASKAAGWRNGVSKNSKIVVLKTTMSLADNTWAFATVLEDVMAKNRQGKAVILYPRSSNHPTAQQLLGWNRIKALMEELMYQDVVIVGCAGDNAMKRGGSNKPNEYPALWASAAFPFIVAGAVTRRGQYSKFSQGTAISQEIAWAPGDPVICASNVASVDQEARGTGLAAGTVAGLAAYLLRQWPQRRRHVARDMRENIYSRSSRPIFPEYEPRVVWNLQDGAHDPNPRPLPTSVTKRPHATPL